MEQLLTIGTLVFTIATLLNVVLQTCKSVLTIRASRKVAALINAVAFGFYTVIVKSIADIDLMVSVPITVVGNLVGVWFALWLMDKIKKDRLWRITVTVKAEDAKIDIENSLEKYNIGYNTIQCNGRYVVDIFSYTQGESTLIKEILTKENVKYCVTEMNQNL